MQKMYETYKDIAEFRLVYINEAHASDSSWSVGYAKTLGIKNHTNYGERCEVAKKLLNDKNLTVPTVIDGMDNKVNKAYSAWPDRIYLVRSDGKLGIAAGRGPFGYVPALDQAREWLAEFKKSGKELTLETKKGSRDFHRGGRGRGGERPTVRGDSKDGGPFANAVGSWTMQTAFNGGQIDATMTLVIKDGRLTGMWKSQGGEMKMSDVTLKGKVLSFTRTMGPDGPPLVFQGTIDGDNIKGKFTHEQMGELKCAGKRS